MSYEVSESLCDYRLEKDGVVLGYLRRTGGGFPWHYAAFAPTEAFEGVRHLFEEVRRLRRIGETCGERGDEEGWEQATDEAERVLGVIKGLGLRLEESDGSGPITCNVIHIDGDRAWFR